MSLGKPKLKHPSTFWIDDEVEQIINNSMARENMRSRGEVICHLLKLSNIFNNTLAAIKTNPEALERAMLELDEMRKKEKLGIFFESMNHEQRLAIIEMVKMIDTGQWQQTRLI